MKRTTGTHTKPINNSGTISRIQKMDGKRDVESSIKDLKNEDRIVRWKAALSHRKNNL